MSNLNLFIEKMKAEGLNDLTINIFTYYYNLFLSGEKGKLSKNQITCPKDSHIIDYDGLNDCDTKNLSKLVIIKLNGGLGTSMGLSKAKSLLPVKDGYTFLDIIAKQTLKLRELYKIDLPLILMDSFNTSADTLEFLKKYPALSVGDLPLDFIQNKFPKVRKDDLCPLSLTPDPSTHNPNEWNPPGHGDLYAVLSTTGLLTKLIEMGYEYIFVSNSDNLGAVVDPKILNKLFDDHIDFAMEVCIRTEMDKKGGHLASFTTAHPAPSGGGRGGALVLREVAQCPDDETDLFQNIEVFKYFNTNNLWINLKALQDKLKENKGFLPLNLILNEKKVEDIPVYQFETAMGAAISLFERSKAICVPRHRFLPVKKNQDLLLLWSDSYELDENFVLTKKKGAKDTILDLDNEHYGKIDQLLKACENGIPSLYHCDSLKIKSFVAFDKEMVFKGQVEM